MGISKKYQPHVVCDDLNWESGGKIVREDRGDQTREWIVIWFYKVLSLTPLNSRALRRRRGAEKRVAYVCLYVCLLEIEREGESKVSSFNRLCSPFTVRCLWFLKTQTSTILYSKERVVYIFYYKRRLYTYQLKEDAVWGKPHIKH